MKRFYLIGIAALVGVACSVSAVSEEPEATPSTKQSVSDDLTRIHTHNVHFSESYSKRLEKGLKLPEAEGVICGVFQSFAGGRVHCCLTRSAKDGKWESVIIDVNNNKNLTDDTALTLPEGNTKGELSIKHNGTDHSFTIQFTPRPKGSSSLTLRPTTGWKGLASLGEKKIAWAVADCNLSGKLDDGDMAHLDLQSKGSFVSRGRPGTLTLKANVPLYHEKEWYSVAANDDGASLAVEPYGEKVCTFSIDTSEITGENVALRNLMIYSRNDRIMLGDVDTVAGIDIPAGTYRYVSASIPMTPKPLRFSIRNLKLTDDKVLALEKPEPKITVTQSGGKIHVGQKIVAPDNVSYSLARGKRGPLVEVFSAEDQGQPAAATNMEYG